MRSKLIIPFKEVSVLLPLTSPSNVFSFYLHTLHFVTSLEYLNEKPNLSSAHSTRMSVTTEAFLTIRRYPTKQFSNTANVLRALLLYLFCYLLCQNINPMVKRRRGELRAYTSKTQFAWKKHKQVGSSYQHPQIVLTHCQLTISSLNSSSHFFLTPYSLRAASSGLINVHIVSHSKG